MGKSWKGRSHLNTGYPYNPIRVANLQSFSSKLEQRDGEGMRLVSRVSTGIYGESGHPIFDNVSLAQHKEDMKHLEFLRTYSNYYCTKVAVAYSNSRSMLPTPCRTGLRSLEDRVTHIGAPLLSNLQESSERVLWSLDSKVDAIIKAAQRAVHSGTMSQARAKHDLIVAEATQARKAYLQQVVDSLQYLREHGLASTARSAVNAILSRVDEAQCLPAERESEAQPLVHSVQDAWGRLAAYPPVTKLIESAQPSIDYTQRKYGDAHDAFVASATYNRALDAAAEVIQRFQDTSLYKAAAGRLYPMVSGVADPAIEKIANSAYAKAVVEHLKPVQKHKQSDGGEVPISCLPC